MSHEIVPPLITRVRIKDYKSIAFSDVTLGSLTFLVGANGAGKSNFLDALRFVTDALRISLDYALRERNGIKEVRRRSRGHPRSFGIVIECHLTKGKGATYGFKVSAGPSGGFEIQEESCRIQFQGKEEAYFLIRNGSLETSAPVAPLPSNDRLYLVAASGLPEFRPVYEALSHMGFYRLNPAEMRELQVPDAGDLLLRDGRNIGSVLKQLARDNKETKVRIEEYLSAVVPGVKRVDAREIGPRETVEFSQTVAGDENLWQFLATNMSDGTLRALGILTALFQHNNGSKPRVPLIGIEEPEVALHPAAARILLDSLRVASQYTQVIVTSHSPELLDDPEISPDSLLAVVSEEGVTKIGPLDYASRKALHDHLYTAGELLRLNQLSPDPAVLESTRNGQQRLF